MKRFLPLILVLCMLLAACGSDENLPDGPRPSGGEPEATAAPTEAPTAAPTEAPTAAPTEAPTEPEPQFQNPLTGEMMFEPMDTRLFAVSIGNTPDAAPNHGGSQADLFFEMFVNDFCTRCFAMFGDISQVPAVGSVRSIRYPFTDLCQSYDAIAIYAGGSGEVLGDLHRSPIDEIMAETVGTDYHYRDRDRQNNGYRWEHCLFVKGPELVKYAADRDIRVTQDPNRTYGLNFTENAAPDGETADKVTVTFTLGRARKDTVMVYDAEQNGYIYNQYNKKMVDGNNDADEVFKNVFVILADVHTSASGYHLPNMLGSGDGYFACDGKITTIKWNRATDDDPFTFTLNDGTPLEQGIGSSYIAIAPTQSAVTFE